MKVPSERKENTKELGAFHPGIILYILTSKKEFKIESFLKGTPLRPITLWSSVKTMPYSDRGFSSFQALLHRF